MMQSCDVPLALQSSGQGDDLILLHGWGMNNAVWGDGFVEQLSTDFRVHRVELPGHGMSTWCGEANIEAVSARLLYTLAQAQIAKAHFCGWSLGGMVAQALLAQRPDRFRTLTLISSTTCFGRCEDWSHAMDVTVLKTFAEQLSEDYRAVLQRFLALQMLNSEQAAQGLRTLRERVYARGEPDPNGLMTGLNILRDFDMRETFAEIDIPVLLIGGERDTLVPYQALQSMQQINSDARLVLYPGTGHAPFIPHPQAVVEQIKVFCHAG